MKKAVSLSASQPTYILNADEKDRMERFFAERILPLSLEQAIEEYITKKAGKPWDDPVTLERLRRAITSQKNDYWKPIQRRNLRYTKGYNVLGYLAYHFPVYYMQTERLLAMLAKDGLLQNSMTVLDVGTGPGVVPLAIADFWSRLDHATATVYSLDRSEEHIEAFMFMRDRCTARGGAVSIKPPIKTDIRNPDLAKIPNQIDLIIFSNVLNELSDEPSEARANLVMMFAERLSPGGSILIVEPAEEVTSTGLRVLSGQLKRRGLTIHSPCTYVWGTNCTPDRCWSFTTAAAIRPTHLMETLASGHESFRYVNTDIKYSYVVLRKDTKTRQLCNLSLKPRVLRLSQIRRHTESRVNVIAAKMSEELGDRKTHIIRVCDGSADIPVFAVLPSYHITPKNKETIDAPYGAILELDNVLVRYNPKYDAYNLLITRNSQINRIPS